MSEFWTWAFTATGELTEAFKALLRPVTMPTGVIVFWPSQSLPDGWLLAGGQEISKTVYAELYTVIGDVWAGVTAPASGNFRLPNLKGKVPVGHDGATFTFGTYIGEETHLLTLAEIPTLTIPDAAATTEVPIAGTFGSPPNAKAGPFSALTFGGGGSHNNIQPTITGHWIIRT